jgi:hypothetical protein
VTIVLDEPPVTCETGTAFEKQQPTGRRVTQMASTVNKLFLVEKAGRLEWVVLRQMAHDPQYRVGSRVPGLGRVVQVRTVEQ